jgi:hypothetical protein
MVTPIDSLIRNHLRGKKATPKQKLEAITEEFLKHTYYYAPKARYFHWDTKTEQFLQFGKDDFREYLTAKGFFNKIKPPRTKLNGQTPSQKKKEAQQEAKASWLKFLRQVWEEKQVDWYGEIAGCRPGLIEQEGNKCLILKGPQLVVPQKGKCVFTRTFVEELFGQQVAPYIFAWLRRALASLYNGLHTFGHALILVGPGSCGKSCFQHALVTPLFGGRNASAFKYMTETTRFNKNLTRSEHIWIDDQSRCKRFNRDDFAEQIKRVVTKLVDDSEAKGIDSVTLRPLTQRLTKSVNDEFENLASLPTNRSDIDDKLLLVSTNPTEILKGLSEQDIAKKFDKERPAFAHWLLNEFEVPETLLVSEDPKEQRTIQRFGFKSYFSPKYADDINRSSRAEQLRDLIHACVGPAGGIREGVPTVVHAEFCNDDLYGEAIKTVARTASTFGTLISELSKLFPKEFQIDRSDSRRWYRIQITRESAPGANPSVHANQ